MEQMINCCSCLGEVLSALREEDAVVARACEENPWFTPCEVVGAAHALARRMLAESELRAWLARYPMLPVKTPRRVGVIMAGNIPFVGFFDLLCLLVAGHRALLKPSSKDRVLIEWVVEQLLKIDPKSPVEWLEEGAKPLDAVIATGSDNALRHFRSAYGSLPTLLRGSRHSVAVLDGTESEEELRGVGRDIFTYSGLGCRNVSLLFLPEGLEPRIEMPEMNPLYGENYRQERALATLLGRPCQDLGGALLMEGEEFSSALSIITIRRYTNLSEVERWLEEHDREVQCVVGRAVSHPRGVAFGEAQNPGLTDYPDAVDVLAFLAKL